MTVEDTAPLETQSGWKAFATRDLLALPLGSLICLSGMYWLAQLIHLPDFPGKAGSLLQQPAPWIAIGAAWLIVLVGTAVATIFAGHVHYDGGLFCACIGLAGLSVRMGSTRYALFEADSSRIYLFFAAELPLLYVAVAIAWVGLRRFHSLGWLPEETLHDPEAPDEPLDQNLLATIAQIIITLVVVMLLCQSDSKPQTLASVGIASYIGALGAHHFVATRPSAWFWIGPLAVGMIGYLFQFLNGAGWTIGDIGGFFAPLARPMPLDYASMGPAGALMGYWTSQRWHRERIEAA